MPHIKLTYFNIEAAAEKVRLTLVMTGTKFEDNRFNFEDWKALKETTPYGQVPVMTVTEDDGTVKEFAQSFAMVRWVARKFDASGTLYPVELEKMLVVDDAVALVEDMLKAWNNPLFLGMGKHTLYGHPEEWPEKAATVQKLRESFIANDFAKFMGFFTKKLEATGAFLCGDKPTIADLVLLPQLRYYAKGVADFVPKDCLSPFPVITAWMDRMYAIPEIKEWYQL